MGDIEQNTAIIKHQLGLTPQSATLRDPNFAAYWKRILKQNQPKSQAEHNALFEAAAYDYKNGTRFTDYYGASYNPWKSDERTNKAITSYINQYGRAPASEKEWTPFYYQGEYGSSLEDQQAPKEGKKPWKYQVTDKIAQKLQDFLPPIRIPHISRCSNLSKATRI